MSGQIDLQQLAYERSAPTAPTSARRRPIVSRYIIPSAILLGFLAMVAWAFRDYFVSRVPVTVVPVVVGQADVQAAGSSLFQSPGWVEPRPTAFLVSALADGVISELMVVDGQPVEAGSPIARLNDTDVQLALRQAELEWKLRDADLAVAKAQSAAAKQRLTQPLHLQAALADAESMLTKTETELSKVPYLLKSAESRVELARHNKEVKESLENVVTGRAIRQAKSEYAIAASELEELQERRPRLEKEVATLTRKRDTLEKQLTLLTDERRQAAETEAMEAAAVARCDQATLAVEQVKIQLGRMTVTAPISGRVLALLALPGSRVSANGRGGNQETTAAIVSLYDPKQLQVRADVRLEDVRLVQPGQPVQIRTATSKQPIRGKVLLPTSSANVQKNTLEVKIALENPPEEIRPEMLVTAEFLAPEKPAEKKQEASKRNVILVPRSLVQKHGGISIWIAGSDGLAHKTPIQLGNQSSGQMVEVIEGLTPTDKLVTGGREGLQEGTRIVITGEDRSFGIDAKE